MKKLLLISGLLLLTLVLLTACGGEENEYEGMVKVTYELEGGSYQNSNDPVTQYYAFEEGTENKIKEPSELTHKPIERPGYRLEGWYTQANGGGSKWDFATDKVSGAGMTLYANWKKNISYTFDLYYKTPDGVDTLLEGGISVDEGQPVTSAFVSLAESSLEMAGMTPLGEWTDESGRAWSIATDVHPGGETDTCIKLYAKYIAGVFDIVRTAKELKSAAAGGRNIYLMNDIDFGGDDFGGFSGTGAYTGTFLGNGHKISNFRLTYLADKNAVKPDTTIDPEGSNLLKVSLFGTLKGATVKDVTFENYTTELSLGTLFGSTKIIVAPFAMSVEGATIENVTVTASYSVGNLPTGFDHADILVGRDKLVYHVPAGDTSVITSSTVEMVEKAM